MNKNTIRNLYTVALLGAFLTLMYQYFTDLQYDKIMTQRNWLWLLLFELNLQLMYDNARRIFSDK